MRVVQVVVPEYSKRWRRLLGGKVRITGTLFHSHTGHHHTAVLIQASKIEPRTLTDEPAGTPRTRSAGRDALARRPRRMQCSSSERSGLGVLLW